VDLPERWFDTGLGDAWLDEGVAGCSMIKDWQ